MVESITKQDFWNSRTAFILASIGSAVGLGNVWRFPYICYTYGGGAFLIPYFVALFTAGIPLLILEFSLGHKMGCSAPEAFKKIGKKYEWIGWWTTFIPFLISLYYVVVMAWCFSYMIYAVDLRWGNQSSTFFTMYLGDSGGPVILGVSSIPVFLSLIIIWIFIFLILYKGVHRIGKIVLLTVPLPWILLGILTIRGLTLPGAIDGLNYYLIPDFSRLGDPSVWLAAYAQVFFSLSLAQGIMITYASFLKKKSDITNNACIVALADAGTSFIAGFAVFSIVGYLAFSQGTTIDALSNNLAGPNLTFITYPTAISLFPVAAAFFGFIFYLALLSFGIDSAFSMLEPSISAVSTKWRLSKAKSTALLCLFGFCASLLFITSSGIHWLKLVDHFIAHFGLILVGLLECAIVGWMYKISTLRNHANTTSELQLGCWWDILICYIIPGILIILLISALVTEIINPYESCPWWVLMLGGVFPLFGSGILAVLFSKITKTKKRGEAVSA
ncbi:MAG: sodium-dependent transporter [Candidatus Thermoplasmatota archaeon]